MTREQDNRGGARGKDRGHGREIPGGKAGIATEPGAPHDARAGEAGGPSGAGDRGHAAQAPRWSLDVLPWFLALAFGRAWLTLTYAAPNAALPDLVPLHYNLFDLAYFAVSVAVVILARRLVPLCEAPWPRTLSLACMLTASACCIAATEDFAPAGLAGALIVGGTILAGVGFSLFLLLWSEVLSLLSMRRIVMQLASSQLLALAILFFCQKFDPLRMGIAIVALPIIAVACIGRTYGSISPAERPARTYAHFSFPWKIVLLLGVYSFAYGIRQQSLTAAGNVFTNIAMVAIMALLFVGARFFSDRFSLSLLYRSPIPLMACGFLLIPAEGVLGIAASNLMVSASYVLASTLFSLLLYDIAKRMGMIVIALFGLKNAAQLFVAGGDGFTKLLEHSALDPTMQMTVASIVVVGAVLVATFILFSEKELTTKWGVSVLDAGGLGERSRREEILSLRCDELSDAYHLSPREDEVLRLLAVGRTAAAIAAELGIAEGTAKAHASHIYEKTGVGGRRDLEELLGVGTSAEPSRAGTEAAT